ncbi:Putative metal chaperone YciC [Caulifigura coniformis]|uniref:Metal chaperone YciC n=2 Tax=Caulifigura coniformis TaxID=2527983 RepID=A0A517SIY1_9PLAN|nr:Putative metal chaperone YciC [Caulifigura coniformis]
MPQQMKFVLVGGFLGAGKTTTISRLARDAMKLGLKVGIVTNDQAQDLVDTNNLRSQGFDVGEVAGACFCCKFDDLVGTVEKLDRDNAPDIILAEPVGSCTDLVATVIQPLKQLYDARFEIAPYAVILKPSQGRKILKNEPGSGFSPKAAYILEKQLEEADVILINRVDELTAAELQELETLLAARYPQTPRLRISARTGEGFEALEEFLNQSGDFGRRILDIDYDIYADGEAELGWLNSSVQVNSAKPFALDELLLDLIGRLKETLAAEGLEPAHLKAIGLWEGFFGVANLVASTMTPELSLPSKCQVKEVDLVVNARVACDPEQLTRLVYDAVTKTCAAFGATATFGSTQSFRPGRPMPTHRMSLAK